MKLILPQELSITYATELKDIVKYAFKHAKRFGSCEIKMKLWRYRKYFRVTYDEWEYASYVCAHFDYPLEARTINQLYGILSNEYMLYISKQETWKHVS